MKKPATLILITLLLVSGCAKRGRKSSDTSIYSSSESESSSEQSTTEIHSSQQSSSEQSQEESSWSSSVPTPVSSSESEIESFSSSEVEPEIENIFIRRIAYAASKYQKITPNELAKKAGVDDTTTLTYSNLFRMLFIAFSNIPELMGARKYQGDFSSYNVARSMNTQEAADYRFLKRHGLIAEDIDPDRIIDIDDVLKYLKRLHAYFGKSYQDDFAYTVNHDFMYTHDKYDGKTYDSTVRDSTLINADVLYDNAFDLLKEASSTYEYSNLSYIVDGFENHQDVDYKVYAPIQDFITNFTAATDFDSLISYCSNEFVDKAMSPLISFDASKDPRWVSGYSGYYLNKVYKVENSKYLTTLLTDYYCNYEWFLEEKEEEFANFIMSMEDIFGIDRVTLNALKDNVFSFFSLVGENLASNFYDGWEKSYREYNESSDPLKNGSYNLYSSYDLFTSADINTPTVIISYMDYYLLCFCC